MPAKKGTGLLMVWCDVPEDREDEFHRWYNEEHLAEILTVPGVLNAARYEAVKGGPKHLACYELDSPAAVLGDGFTKRTKSKWSETMGADAHRPEFLQPALRDDLSRLGLQRHREQRHGSGPADRPHEYPSRSYG